jgi:hypothetical protein
LQVRRPLKSITARASTAAVHMAATARNPHFPYHLHLGIHSLLSCKSLQHRTPQYP